VFLLYKTNEQMSGPVIVYDFPFTTTLLGATVFKNALGVMKLPGTLCETGRHRGYFGVLLVLYDDHHKLVPVVMSMYNSIETPITTTTRSVLIELLKVAIKNTGATLSEYDANIPIFASHRQFYMDVLLHAEICLEELMQEEAAERAKVAAAKKIQHAFLNATYTPTHPFCHRRLMREFSDLVVEAC